MTIDPQSATNRSSAENAVMVMINDPLLLIIDFIRRNISNYHHPTLAHTHSVSLSPLIYCYLSRFSLCPYVSARASPYDKG